MKTIIGKLGRKCHPFAATRVGIYCTQETPCLYGSQRSLLVVGSVGAPPTAIKDFYDRVTGFKATMKQPQGTHSILHDLVNVTDDIVECAQPSALTPL